MENLWKYSSTHYCLYVSNPKTIQSINRYYLQKGFSEMAVYQNSKGKIVAKQYLVPINLLRTAKRLANNQ